MNYPIASQFENAPHPHYYDLLRNEGRVRNKLDALVSDLERIKAQVEVALAYAQDLQGNPLASEPVIDLQVAMSSAQYALSSAHSTVGAFNTMRWDLQFAVESAHLAVQRHEQRVADWQAVDEAQALPAADTPQAA